MLFDDASTVDTDDLSVREGFADDSQRFGVEVGLGIGGTEHGTIDDRKLA